MQLATLMKVLLMLQTLQDAYSQIAESSRNKYGKKLLDDHVMVPDSAFSASSFFVHPNKGTRKIDFSPKAARESYDKENLEFAWCPKHKIQQETREYLEIDLGRLVVITIISTRGRFDQGAGKEYSPFYKVKYQRSRNEKWKLYRKIEQTKGRMDLLNGPSDTFLDVFVAMEPPIVTRYIRIYPFSYNTRRVCMKLQIFGTQFDNHLLEYRAPQGSVQSSDWPVKLPEILPGVVRLFEDSSYDGAIDHINHLLTGGLGRLADNVTGGNFTAIPIHAVRYVGWSRTDLAVSTKNSVVIWFRFNSVRNFSSVRIHGYNDRQAALPTRIEAKFSRDGRTFLNRDAIVVTEPASLTTVAGDDVYADWPLASKLGSFVTLTLFFRARWMLLSEISFSSTEPKSQILNPSLHGNDSVREPKILSLPEHETPLPPGSRDSNSDQNRITMSSMDAVYMLIILLCLLLAVICAICVFLFVVRRRRQRKKNNIKKQELSMYPPGDGSSMFKTALRHSTSQKQHPHTPSSNHRAGGATVGAAVQGMQYPPLSNYYSTTMSRKEMGMEGTGIHTFPTNNNGFPKSLGVSPQQQQQQQHQQQQLLNNEAGSIYTSIPGSDNDSTDYGGSCTNSSHPYTQTVPYYHALPSNGTLPTAAQPHIIGNPFVDFQVASTIPSNTGINNAPNFMRPTYEPDHVAMTASNASNHSNQGTPQHLQHHQPHHLTGTMSPPPSSFLIANFPSNGTGPGNGADYHGSQILFANYHNPLSAHHI